MIEWGAEDGGDDQDDRDDDEEGGHGGQGWPHQDRWPEESFGCGRKENEKLLNRTSISSMRQSGRKKG